MIVYLHGFNSSPASFKARLIAERMRMLGLGEHFRAPALPDLPARAMDAIEAELSGCDPSALTLVGSSLGGVYATRIAERSGCRAALINPAVRAHELLAAHLGMQTNLHTGARYELTPEHLAQLRALDVPAITRPQRYLLLVTTGDEVLDYREAVAKYAGARQIVVQGGDHGFGSFAACVDTVLEFAGLIPAAG